MSATQGVVTAVRVAREQAGDYRVTFDDRRRYGSVKAYWYDRSAGQRREVTAGSDEPVYALRDDQVDAQTARLRRSGPAGRPEPWGGHTEPLHAPRRAHRQR